LKHVETPELSVEAGLAMATQNGLPIYLYGSTTLLVFSGHLGDALTVLG
jgi:hypothetical protein